MKRIHLRGVLLRVVMMDGWCELLLPSYAIWFEEIANAMFEPGKCPLEQPFVLQLHEWRQLRTSDAVGAASGSAAGAAAAALAYAACWCPVGEDFLGMTHCVMHSLDIRPPTVDFWANGVSHIDLGVMVADRGASFPAWRQFPNAVYMHIAVHGMAVDHHCSDMHLLKELDVFGKCDVLRLDVRRCTHLGEVNTDGLVGACSVAADGCPGLRQ